MFTLTVRFRFGLGDVSALRNSKIDTLFQQPPCSWISFIIRLWLSCALVSLIGRRVHTRQFQLLYSCALYTVPQTPPICGHSRHVRCGRRSAISSAFAAHSPTPPGNRQVKLHREAFKFPMCLPINCVNPIKEAEARARLLQSCISAIASGALAVSCCGYDLRKIFVP